MVYVDVKVKNNYLLCCSFLFSSFFVVVIANSIVAYFLRFGMSAGAQSSVNVLFDMLLDQLFN
jgi:Na+/melibiose symporter-like transporter